MINQSQLTDKQRESIDFDPSSDMLVKGVAGSGKSVVLMQRALKFNTKAIQTGETKRILLLTFTKALVSYMEETLKELNLKPCMIEVSTISSCCFNMYRRKVKGGYIQMFNKNCRKEDFVTAAIRSHLRTHEKHRFHDIEPDFWGDEFSWIKQKHITSQQQYVDTKRTGRAGKVRMTKEDKKIAYEIFEEYCSLLKQKNVFEWEDLFAHFIESSDGISDRDKYDYVLIDEAQDLSYVNLKFAKLLAKESITIAADKAQKIYKTSFAWKELGIDIRGRASKSLDKTFRSTKQIIELADSLMAVNRALEADLSEFTDPVIPERTGSTPVVLKCSNALDERNTVLHLIKKTAASKSVGLLYRSYEQRYMLLNWLDQAGISYEMRDDGWTIGKPGVKLVTLHSSKGLEFDVVIIPFFSNGVIPLESTYANADNTQKVEILAQERNLLYVGMTRARYDLYITHSGEPSQFLNDLDHEYYDYLTPQGEISEKPERTDIQKIQRIVEDNS